MRPVQAYPSLVSQRGSYSSGRTVAPSVRQHPPANYAAPALEPEPAPSSDWGDLQGGAPLQVQTSYSNMMQQQPPLATPIATAESITTMAAPVQLPAQPMPAAPQPGPQVGPQAGPLPPPLPLEYEEVPPWNKPRSVDDIHFTYSMKCETSACRIFRCLALIFPTGLITVGATNLYHCPMIPWLPHWSIIAGCLWFVHCGFYFLFRQSNEKNTRGYRFIKGLFLYLVFVEFVVGTALVYGTASTTRFFFSSSSCHYTLFYSAFGLITAGYLILAVLLWFYIFTFTFSFYEPEMVV